MRAKITAAISLAALLCAGAAALPRAMDTVRIGGEEINCNAIGETGPIDCGTKQTSTKLCTQKFNEIQVSVDPNVSNTKYFGTILPNPCSNDTGACNAQIWHGKIQDIPCKATKGKKPKGDDIE